MTNSLSWTHIDSDGSSAGGLDYEALDGAGNPGVVLVSAGNTPVDLSAVSSPYLAIITNHDDTKTIDVGVEDGGSLVPFMSLAPGEAMPLRMYASATYLMRIQDGSAGTVRVSFEAYTV